MTGAELVALVDDAVCHAACLFGTDEMNGSCSCRCNGQFHGAARKGESEASPIPAMAPPVGWWFHSWEPTDEPENTDYWYTTKTINGVRCHRQWQGQIVGNVGPSHYLVQTYSWHDGSSYEGRVIEAQALMWFTLYQTNEDMLMAGGCDEIMDGYGGRRGRCGRQKVGYVEAPGFGRQYLCSSCMDHYSGKRVIL